VERQNSTPMDEIIYDDSLSDINSTASYDYKHSANIPPAKSTTCIIL
jgi:hypothetical protein